MIVGKPVNDIVPVASLDERERLRAPFQVSRTQLGGAIFIRTELVCWRILWRRRGVIPCGDVDEAVCPCRFVGWNADRVKGRSEAHERDTQNEDASSSNHGDLRLP